MARSSILNIVNDIHELFSTKFGAITGKGSDDGMWDLASDEALMRDRNDLIIDTVIRVNRKPRQKIGGIFF